MQIEKFYRYAIARKRNSSNLLYKIINKMIYMENVWVGNLCYKSINKNYSIDIQHKKNSSDKKIIVSFTTIPSRIKYIPTMLKSIFNQSLKPDKIILWITDEIKDKNEIISYLNDEIQKGLIIRFVKDIRVHTKYYYAMKEYKDDLVITVDDDILYPENLIEQLYCKHLEYPNAIICNRAHQVTYTNGKINSYKKWNKLAPGKMENDELLIATGVGGVLYPPKSLYEDWENINLFLSLSPNADDIWLWFMEILKKTPIVKLNDYTKEMFVIQDAQSIALSKANVNEDRNDKYIKICSDYYEEQIKKILGEK